jgi:hypothetical protein
MRFNLRWSFFALALWALSVGAQAGVASLTDAEVMRLQVLVKGSLEARIWAETLDRRAQEAVMISPGPVTEIQTAGKLRGSPEKTATELAAHDMDRMWALALSYALSGKVEYAQKAQSYLLAWAQTCQPPPNPIDATNLEGYVETYDLLRPHLAAQVRKTLDHWIGLVFQTLETSDDPAKKNYWNNWKAHRLKIMTLIAYTLDDPEMKNQVLETFKALLNHNLNPDGSTFDFQERDALHYQVYDLEPMLRTVMIFERADTPGLYGWKTDQGASIRNCVAFVLPYAKGEKTHPEFVHSTVEFDYQRAQNNEKNYTIGADFIPKASLHCLELAQFFQPDLKSLVGTLAGKPDAAYPTLQILLNETTRPSPSPSSTL